MPVRGGLVIEISTIFILILVLLVVVLIICFKRACDALRSKCTARGTNDLKNQNQDENSADFYDQFAMDRRDASPFFPYHTLK